MGIHVIECFVPGVDRNVAGAIEAALRQAGRVVSARQPLVPGSGNYLTKQPGTLRWYLYQLSQQRGNFLVLDETGPPDWDLGFLRTLSAVVDGFVVARDQYDWISRQGVATFFAGHTLEIFLAEQGTEIRRTGDLPMYQWAAGRTADEILVHYFTSLCDAIPPEWHGAPMLMAEDWQVSPPDPSLVLPPEMAEVRMLLPYVEPEDWPAAADLARGCQHRLLRTSRIDSPYVDLRYPGALDETRLLALSSALHCPAIGVELPSAGAGGQFRWAEAYQGVMEATGQNTGAKEFFKVMGQASFLMGEHPSMLFGRGQAAWME